MAKEIVARTAKVLLIKNCIKEYIDDINNDDKYLG